jgi:hypothetical protein
MMRLSAGRSLQGWAPDSCRGPFSPALPPRPPRRAGRTGRAGKSGTAIAMFQPKEIGYFKRILRETETQGVKLIPAPSPTQVIEAAAKQVRTRLTAAQPWGGRSCAARLVLLCSPRLPGPLQRAPPACQAQTEHACLRACSRPMFAAHPCARLSPSRR